MTANRWWRRLVLLAGIVAWGVGTFLVSLAIERTYGSVAQILAIPVFLYVGYRVGAYGASWYVR